MADSRKLLVLFSWLMLTVIASAVDPSNVRSVADNNTRTKSNAPDKAKSEPARVSAVDTESAHQLVRVHLPELRAVLHHLRADDPTQYKRAVQDLARSARKLEAAKKRDERLYDIEVETLKAQNAVHMLTAKLKVRDNENDRKLLRKATERLKRSQLSRAEYEVDMLEARIKRTQQLLQNAEQRVQTRRDNMDDELEKSYVLSLRKAGRSVDAKSPRPRSKVDRPKSTSSKASDKPARSTDRPARSTDRPARSTDGPAKANDKSAKDGERSDRPNNEKPTDRKPPARVNRK